jgi:hypothetical protein
VPPTSSNPALKAYCRRLRSPSARKPTVALIACVRKLIVILNTMLEPERRTTANFTVALPL